MKMIGTGLQWKEGGSCKNSAGFCSNSAFGYNVSVGVEKYAGMSAYTGMKKRVKRNFLTSR